jgi:hypothetical protein
MLQRVSSPNLPHSCNGTTPRALLSFDQASYLDDIVFATATTVCCCWQAIGGDMIDTRHHNIIHLKFTKSASALESHHHTVVKI